MPSSGGTDDEDDYVRGRHSVSGGPTEIELIERMARLEEQQKQLGQGITRIEDRLEADHSDLQERIDTVEPRNERIWMLYQGTKWVTMLLSGGGVLALLITLILTGSVG